MKKIFIIFLLPLYLYSFDSMEYKNIMDKPLSKQNIEKLKKEFSFMNNPKKERGNINKELMKELSKSMHKMPFNDILFYFQHFYKGTKFLTKEEAVQLVQMVHNQKINAFNNSHMFLLYFFTESVPKSSVSNILLGVKVLQDNGLNIETKQYLTGPSDNIKDYLESWKTFIYGYPFKYQNGVVRNFHLKFDPRFFKVYKINKAPAMAIAFCQSAIPTPKTCRIKYLIRGDTSLFNFFDKIGKVEPKYNKYANFLKANGIYLPKKKRKHAKGYIK